MATVAEMQKEEFLKKEFLSAVTSESDKIVNWITRFENKPDTGDYLVDMVWWTESLDDIPLGGMTRSHVRNALQWCIRKNPPNATVTKDGFTYQQWITAFTIRLLDPDLP
jgi:hypothetical protein